MSRYNLRDYSLNYSKTTVSLWLCSKNEATDFNADIANDGSFKSFKYQVKLKGNTAGKPASDAGNGILKNTIITVILKYFDIKSNFWRSLEMPLINCKVELKLKWTKHCVLSALGNESKVEVNNDANNIIFTIKETKLFVLVITLSARGNQKLSKILSKRFERSLY